MFKLNMLFQIDQLYRGIFDCTQYTENKSMLSSSFLSMIQIFLRERSKSILVVFIYLR